MTTTQWNVLRIALAALVFATIAKTVDFESGPRVRQQQLALIQECWKQYPEEHVGGTPHRDHPCVRLEAAHRAQFNDEP